MKVATMSYPMPLEFIPSAGLSEASEWITQERIKALFHYTWPVTRQATSLESTFSELVETWKEDCASISSLNELIIHPAYQRIIGLGMPAVPLLLKELEKAPNHWFWALAFITGENQVKEEQSGRIKEMAKSWIEWGRKQGHI